MSRKKDNLMSKIKNLNKEENMKEENLVMHIDTKTNDDYENDSEIEREIDNILSNIHDNDDLDDLEDIEELRQLAIDKVFSTYMVYEKNIKNKEIAERELQGYKFVDIGDLKKGDYVRYFNLTYFCDLKLTVGGTIVDLNYKDTGDIIIIAPYAIKRIKPNIFFQKIKTDDLVKMKLIQIADNI